MTIDIEAIKSRLNDAYCGHADYEEAISGACNDVADLLDEVARLRAEVARERAATVSWLRLGNWTCVLIAEKIQRGDHRRGEER